MNEKTSFQKHMLLSITSASMAELITLPIDTIKVHLQANLIKPTNPNPLNSTINQPTLNRPITTNITTNKIKSPIMSTINQIYTHQGIKGFYGSWIAATTRQALSSGTRIGLYAYFRDKNYPYSQTPLGTIGYGSLCGLLSNVVALPADVIKTRIQSNHHPISTVKAIQQINQEHGVRGFYRGFNQTALRAVTISSIQLPLYFKLQEVLQRPISIPIKQNNQQQNNQQQNNQQQNQQYQLSLNQRTAVASVLTTITVSTAVYPVDLIKTQVQNNQTTTKQLLHQILIKQKNPFLLYRGLSIGIIRSLPHFWITTMIYENLKSRF